MTGWETHTGKQRPAGMHLWCGDTHEPHPPRKGLSDTQTQSQADPDPTQQLQSEFQNCGNAVGSALSLYS